MARASPMRAPLEREKKPARRRGKWAEGAKIGQGDRGGRANMAIKSKKRKTIQTEKTADKYRSSRGDRGESVRRKKGDHVLSGIVTRRSILESFPRFIAIAIAPILEPFTAISRPPPCLWPRAAFHLPRVEGGERGFPKILTQKHSPPFRPRFALEMTEEKKITKSKPPFLAKQATRRHSCPCSQAKEGGKLWRGPPPVAPLFFFFGSNTSPKAWSLKMPSPASKPVTAVLIERCGGVVKRSSQTTEQQVRLFVSRETGKKGGGRQDMRMTAQSGLPIPGR